MIKKLSGMLKSGDISCTELTRKYLSAIERENTSLNALTVVTAESALESAAKIDEKLASGEDLPLLAGIPMSLKANISTSGIETDCCSKILSGYKPIYNATVWQKLSGEGAVLLGKANMDEFAMGSSCESSCHGAASNPHDLSKVPGGSSGGGAASVSGNISAYSLGSDTGGSIRQPASFCGCIGLKPSYGAVSRFGLIAYASSLDQIGPITSSVEDSAIVFDAISGRDAMDSTSQSCESAMATLENGVKGMKIGVPGEYFEGIGEDVGEAVNSAVKTFEKMGAEIVPVNLPALEYSLPVYYIIACAEASSNLGRYDGIRYGYRASGAGSIHEMICKTRSEGFGEEVKHRILLGTYVLSSGYYDAYYKKAQNLRGAVISGFNNAFSSCDILIAPTVPETAFKKGFASADPVKTYMTDICTVPVNIAGLPAISLPCGFDRSEMPVGMQLIGKAFAEPEILRAAFAFERETDGAFIKKCKMGVEL